MAAKDGGGPTVLIVDDEASVRAMLGYVLHDEGYDVREAADGVEAIEELTVSAPDAMVLDLMMPNGDGLSVLRARRERGFAPDTRVLILTAKTTSEDAVWCWELGADEYLVKPVDPDKLAWEMRNLLARTPNELEHRRRVGLAVHARQGGQEVQRARHQPTTGSAGRHQGGLLAVDLGVHRLTQLELQSRPEQVADRRAVVGPAGRGGDHVEAERETAGGELLEIELEVVEVGAQRAPPVHDEEDVAVPVVDAALRAPRRRDEWIDGTPLPSPPDSAHRFSRASSTIRQRSCTTLIPASANRFAASSFRMPSCIQTLFGFAARMSSTCGGMSLGRRNTLTMSMGRPMAATCR